MHTLETTTSKPRNRYLMAKQIRVLLVEDHALFREALSRLFAPSREFFLHRAVGTTEDAEQFLKTGAIDVVLLDLTLQGENASAKIGPWREKYPHTEIVALSESDNAGVARRSMDSGAIGFVSKFDTSQDLFAAIRKAASKTSYISKKVQGPSFSGRGEGLPDLSEREREILREIAAGRPVRQIAERLGISTKTVERHRENIKTKLNLDSASGVLREAMRLFPSED